MSLILLPVLFYFFRYTDYISGQNFNLIESLFGSGLAWLFIAICYEVIKRLLGTIGGGVISKCKNIIFENGWFGMFTPFLLIVLTYEISKYLNNENIVFGFDFTPTLSLTLLSAYVLFFAFLYTEQKHIDEKDFYWGINVKKFHLDGYGSVKITTHPMFQMFIGLILLFPFFDDTVKDILVRIDLRIDYQNIVTAWKLLLIINVGLLISTLSVRLSLLRSNSWWGQKKIEFKVEEDVEKNFIYDIINRKTSTFGYFDNLFKNVYDNEIKIEILYRTLIEQFWKYSVEVSDLSKNITWLEKDHDKIFKIMFILWHYFKTDFFKKEYKHLILKTLFKNEPDWSNSILKKERAIRDLYEKYFDMIENLEIENKKEDENIFETLNLKNEIFSHHHKIYWWDKEMKKDSLYLNFGKSKKINHGFYLPNHMDKYLSLKNSISKFEIFMSQVLNIEEIDKTGYIRADFLNEYIHFWNKLESQIVENQKISLSNLEDENNQLINELENMIKRYNFDEKQAENERIKTKFLNYINKQ